MKNQLNTIAFTIIVFAFVLIGLACNNSTPQNNVVNDNTANNNTNQNNTVQNSNSNSDDGDVSVADYNCDGNAAEKIRKVNRRMTTNIQNDNNLGPQYAARNFNFEPVADAEDNVVLYIWGFIYTDKDNVDKLNNIYKKFVKRGCVNKVVFKESPNTNRAVAAGFDFTLCEAPNYICSDGTCRPDCRKIATANTNTNTNSNSNTNTNSNSNKVSR